VTSRPPDVTPDPVVAAARRALVLGLGVTGRAVAAALVARGVEVLVVEDHPTPTTADAAQSLAVELLEAPGPADLDAALDGVDVTLPSPGVPDGHPLFALAVRRSVPVRSEFDLAGAWDDRPLAVITGTDGKTTVTTMVTEMLEASGVAAVACGNTELPLVTAIDDPSTQVFVVEASSFRLGHTHRVRARVATWLNFSPDHLDVHASLDTYEAAKARIWHGLAEAGGTAVVNVDDPVVARNVPVGAATVTYSLDPAIAADARVLDDRLVVGDHDLVGVSELRRALPHDLANALAASATALQVGATPDGVRQVLRRFTGLAHRVQHVADMGGIAWYDDSKATTPHAALAAVAGFASVVLVAGGRNKGLDLGVLAAAVPPVHAVVAIGEAGPEIAAAFAPTGVEVRTATADIGEAVRLASEVAVPGDAVVLSPACTSFDWFGSYAERGDAFQAAVRALAATEVGRR
jgi:UDP-N-acetylmuramoylalanine--D-glutamate ligase